MSLHCENISKYYDNGLGTSKAIDGITASFSHGTLNLLLGESGSGKSTLLKILSGLIRPSKGSVIYNDIDITKISSFDVIKIRREQFGFVFQEVGLLNHLTNYENVIFPSIGRHSQEAIDLAEHFKVKHCLDKFPHEVSLGERQRLLVIRALFKKPKVLFADEPSANLDWANTQVFVNQIMDFVTEGNTVVMATHDERLIEYASSILRLKKGKLI